MKHIQHDIAFAFIVLVGLILMYSSTRYGWFFIPGEVVIGGIDNTTLTQLSSMDQFSQEFLKDAYEERSHFLTARWPYLWNFKLSYVVLALFLFGFISFIRGLGIIRLSWKWILCAVSVPFAILATDFIIELLRGSTALAGIWLCIGGGVLIVFGTIMMKPKSI